MGVCADRGSRNNKKKMSKQKMVLWAAVVMVAFGVGFALGVALWEGNVAPPESGGAGVATR